MLKTFLLSCSVMISVPAMAQTAQTAPVPSTDAANAMQASPQTTTSSQAMPTTQTPSTATTPMTPASPTTAAAPNGPVTTAQQSAPAKTDQSMAQQPAPTQSAQAQPANDPGQVAQVVNQQFGTYDKNKDGKLDAAEFGSWMVALKTAADPSTKPDDPATKAYESAAFAQADINKDKEVSKAELTTFLTKPA